MQQEVLSIEELRRVPGSFGDPTGASIPGARSVEGALVVRGAEAVNTGTYVDGARFTNGERDGVRFTMTRGSGITRPARPRRRHAGG